MQKTNKFNEFSMLRAIGALSVVIIHTTSIFSLFSNTSFSYLSFGIINKFCNFAVPLFLFLSITLLIKNAITQDTLNVLEFYKRRFLKTVPIFLLYIAVYYLYQKANNIELINPLEEPSKFFTTYILQGHIFYHLYFMPIIFQLYIIFPVIHWCVKKIRELKINVHPIVSFILTFCILILLQFAFQKIHKYYIWPNFQSPAIILFTYLIPIGMGTWIGINYESFKNSKFIKILALIIACISGTLFIRYTLYPTIRLNGLILPIYTASICIVLLSISIILVNKTRFLKTILNEISKHSLNIYLIHPLILDIFIRNFEIIGTFKTNLIYAIIKFTVILSISYLFSLTFSLIQKGIQKLFSCKNKNI